MSTGPVLLPLLLAVLVLASRTAPATAIEQGYLYSSVRESPFGSLICDGKMEAEGLVTYVAGCQESAGVGASGWEPTESSNGFCRRCPPDGDAVVCERGGAEFLANSTIRFYCEPGSRLRNGAAAEQRCTEFGWQPAMEPECVSDAGPTSVCPSRWGDWTECQGPCNERGVRFRYRTKFFISPGNAPNEYDARCGPESGYGECDGKCPETTSAVVETTPAVVETTPTVVETTPAVETQESVATTSEAAKTEPTTVPDVVKSTVQETTQEEATQVPVEIAETTGDVVVPNEIAAETTADVAETTAGVAGTTAGSVETTANGVETTADSVETTADAIEPTENAAETTDSAAETPAAQPQEPGPKKIGAIPQPQRPRPQGVDEIPDAGGEQPEEITGRPVEPTVDAVAPTEPAVTCLYLGRDYPVGTELTVVCPPGWRRQNGREVRRCKDSGEWHGSEPICVNVTSRARESCPPPSARWHECSKECLDIPGPRGVQYRYTHVINTEFVGPNTLLSRCVLTREERSCDGDYRCRGVTCSVPDVLNGDTHVVLPGGSRILISNGVPNATLLNIDCHRFYEPTNYESSLCRHGLWIPPPSRCQLIPKHSCSSHAAFQYGICEPVKEEYAIGDHVICRCQHPYGNNGSGIRYCHDGDRWSGTPPVCKRNVVKCGSPGVPVNGILRHGPNFRDVGSRVRYFCNHGFTRIGQRDLTCQRDGAWDHPLPACRYNFQAVSALVHRLRQVPNVPCSASGLCQCVARQSCPGCAVKRNPYRPLRVAEPCCGWCRRCCLDLVFALDESGSVTDKQFLAAVEFIKSVVLAYQSTHPAGCLRVGGVKFDHTARVMFNLTDAGTWEWPNAELTPRGGGTGIRCGLTKVTEVFEQARPECRKVLFLITDGRSNHCGNPKRAAAELKCDCTETYVVGIGSQLNLRKLAKIASQPQSSHMFVLQEFEQLFHFGAVFSNGVYKV